MYTVELYFDLPSTAWFARCVTILNNSTFFRLQGSSLEELRKLFELLLPAPVCENAKTLLTLVQRLGGALSEQRELKQIAMESVAEVVCAMRNAAQREEDWLRILEEIDNDLAFQQKHVKKLNMEGAKATLQERLGCSSDLVKLASRKLEMLVGASGAMGLEAYIPQQHRDQAQASEYLGIQEECTSQTYCFPKYASIMDPAQGYSLTLLKITFSSHNAKSIS